MAYIEFSQIDKYYGRQQVLKDLNLKVEKGQLVTLLGASGCGKSTLLRCLAGFESMESGRIFLDGEDITLKDPRQRSIGMIFQQYSLFPTMTVEANVSFGLRMQKSKGQSSEVLVEDALRMVNLHGMGKKYPSQLSGGEQQRVALARSLITSPKVLLLDEPFSAIDAKLRKELQARVKEIQRDLGMTCIFVTHDQDEAMGMSDVIHLMKEGVIQQSASPQELYAAPQSAYTAGFIGNYNLLNPEELAKLTGISISGQWAAIRPESIRPRPWEPEGYSSGKAASSDNGIQIRGIVREILHQGNITRCLVDSSGVGLKVDLLFDEGLSYGVGDPIYLVLDESKIIEL